jgi:hypothetical protein
MPATFGTYTGTNNDWDTFCYYAVNGAYSTAMLDGAAGGSPGPDRTDAEGYVGIPTVTNEGGIMDAVALLGSYDRTDAYTAAGGDYMEGNVIGPGDEVSFTLKLMIPEPCTGSFTDGAILIYGEAI